MLGTIVGDADVNAVGLSLLIMVLGTAVGDADGDAFGDAATRHKQGIQSAHLHPVYDHPPIPEFGSQTPS